MFDVIQRASLSSELIVGAAVKGLCLTLIACFAILFLRRSSASRRHLVWTVTAFGLILIPVMSIALPRVRVSIPRHWVITEVERPALSGERQTPVLLPAKDAPVEVSPESRSVDAKVASASTAPVTASDKPSGPTTANTPWVLTVWWMGASLALVGPLTGLWQILALGRQARDVVDSRLLRGLEQAKAKIGVRRNVRLVTSARSSTPLTWGVLRPVVLLPPEAINWSESRLNMVLLHELGHIKRFDWLTQMAAQLACALHWFNPLAWLIGRRMQVERELACDDLVLQTGAEASGYAGELLYFAQRLQSRLFLAIGAVPMARQSSLEQRVRGVLDLTRERSAATRKVLVFGTLLALGVLAPLVVLNAALVDQTHVPSVVSKDGLTAFSVVRGGRLEYTILYVGDFDAQTDFARDKKAGTWTDNGVLALKDTQVKFHRNHRMPGQVKIGGLPRFLNAGRVFVIDTITPRPEKPFQVRQVDADIPVPTASNLEKVFEASHKSRFLPISTMGLSTVDPGSRKAVHLELFQRHDQYRTRFALLHSVTNSSYDVNGSNDARKNSWVIDDTLHLDKIDVRFRCQSENPDSLRINNREFDLTKGRMFSLSKSFQPIQHAIFPRVLRDPNKLVGLAKQLSRKSSQTVTTPSERAVSLQESRARTLSAAMGRRPGIHKHLVQLKGMSEPPGVSRIFPAVAIQSDGKRTIVATAAWGGDPFFSLAPPVKVARFQMADGSMDVELVAHDETLGVSLFRIPLHVPPWPADRIYRGPLSVNDKLSIVRLGKGEPDAAGTTSVEAINQEFNYETGLGQKRILQNTIVVSLTRMPPCAPLLRDDKLAAIYFDNARRNGKYASYALPAPMFLARANQLMDKAELSDR